MSRLTGTDAYGLMGAYNAVYAPQEITEEQVWEEVETWVNSLVEEGYDLSEYTWEEMYESYLNEDLMGDLRANAGNIVRGAAGAYQGAMKTASNVNQAVSDRMQRNIKSAKPKPAMPGLPPSARQVTQYPQGVSTGVGGGNAGASRQPAPRQQAPAAPARPAAAPARPGTPPARPGTPPARSGAPARPAAAGPKPTATATTTPTPAPSAPRQKDTSITDMIGRSQVRQGATVNTGSSTSDARAIAARASVGATPKPAPTPAAKPTPRQARLHMEMEYDTFDTVLEYLVSEGYADTEEAALVIMANMSEEWKQSIVEDFPNVLNFPRQGGSRSGDAGTRGLTKTPTGYINRHSRGEDLPPGTVNKIMGGNLMVKNQNTKSNIKTA